MAKKDNDFETDISNEYVDPIREIEQASSNVAERILMALVPDQNQQEMVDVSAMLDKAGFNSPRVKLSDMSGRPFIILLFHSFTSSYEGQDVAYHAICEDAETHERFQTVIGNQRGVELLQAAERANVRGGLKVCFNYVEGKGRFGKYYTMS